MLTLSGKTMVISGAGGGRGLAIIGAALEAGMNVGVLSGSHRKAQTALAKLDPRYRDRVAGFAQDPQFALDENLAEAPDVYAADSQPENVLEWIAARFGGIDVVVNGTGPHARHDLEGTDLKIWRRSMDVMEDAFFSTKVALPHLKQSGGARVINLTTCDGRGGGWDLNPSFAAARGGMIAMTQALAKELGPYAITVNVVASGHLEQDVPSEDALPDETRAELLAKTPLGRLAAPQDIPGAVLFLASEEASFVTGTVIDVNGGVVFG